MNILVLSLILLEFQSNTILAAIPVHDQVDDVVEALFPPMGPDVFDSGCDLSYESLHDIIPPSGLCRVAGRRRWAGAEVAQNLLLTVFRFCHAA
jgi:hypothetical protein